MVHFTNKQARSTVIELNKTKSLKSKNPVKLTYGDEKFVFQDGTLVEYELVLQEFDIQQSTIQTRIK